MVVSVVEVVVKGGEERREGLKTCILNVHRHLMLLNLIRRLERVGCDHRRRWYLVNQVRGMGLYRQIRTHLLRFRSLMLWRCRVEMRRVRVMRKRRNIRVIVMDTDMGMDMGIGIGMGMDVGIGRCGCGLVHGQG